MSVASPVALGSTDDTKEYADGARFPRRLKCGIWEREGDETETDKVDAVERQHQLRDSCSHPRLHRVDGGVSLTDTHAKSGCHQRTRVGAPRELESLRQVSKRAGYAPVGAEEEPAPRMDIELRASRRLLGVPSARDCAPRISPAVRAASAGQCPISA